jgi:four helix bundle protein
MSSINKFEDFETGQLARQLCVEVFEIIAQENFRNDFSLKDQIKRSSGSIMDTIAEGYGRDGSKEFIQFLSYAKGSALEVQSQLYRALDNNQ